MSDANDFVINNGVLEKYKGYEEVVLVPEGVKSIGDSAFYDCGSLTSITLPEGVTSIGDSAFYNCGSLTSINLPDSITSIRAYAFSVCKNLININLPDSITSIGNGAFYGCSSLTSITLPDSLTSIGGDTFDDCGSLTSITLPEGVKSIGNGAFKKCSSLRSIKLPESLTGIHFKAFNECDKLTYVQLHLELLPFINLNAFMKCNFVIIMRKECGYTYLAYCSKSDRDNFNDYVFTENWTAYDLELINNGPVYKYKMPVRLLGALGRLLEPAGLTEENQVLYVEMMNKNAKKLVPIAEELSCPEILSDLLSLGILDSKTNKALRKLLAASTLPEIAALADANKVSVSPEPEQKKNNASQDPLQKEFAEKLKAIKGDVKMKYNLRNENYVNKFLTANGILKEEDYKNTGLEHEIKVLKIFLKQFNKSGLGVILFEGFEDDSEDLSKEEMIETICDLYREEKEELVSDETGIAYFIDNLVTVVIDNFDSYAMPYPEEFLD